MASPRSRWSALCVLLTLAANSAIAQDRPPPADPLTATVDISDVQRFEKLWRKTGGNPTAAQIDSEYIKGGGRGVVIYTPNRIVDGSNMAKHIASERALYANALGKCLPWVADVTPDLRSIYLGLHGLLPERPLPQVYMVIGGANSGGTAGPGAQVLGLEIICRDAPTPDQFRQRMRAFFAHETAHTFQQDQFTKEALAEPLLTQILSEGGPDYVASLVTGSLPDAKREAFGAAHAAEIWTQFSADRPIANRDFKPETGYGKAGQAAFSHWLYNGGKTRPPGWEVDMGYWLGMQIAKAYVDKAADPHAAIRDILALENPSEILRKSGYAEAFRK